MKMRSSIAKSYDRWLFAVTAVAAIATRAPTAACAVIARGVGDSMGIAMCAVVMVALGFTVLRALG
jgi:hypothetical protein